MRIALNLLYLLPDHVGGAQTYADELIRALARVDSRNEYLLLQNREAAERRIVEASNFRHVACLVRARRREARYAYEQIVLPMQLRALGVDVVHSPGYVGPLAAPCASVVSVLDLNFRAIKDTMTSRRQRVLDRIVPACARRADQVLTLSEFSRQQIVAELGVPAERVHATRLAGRPVEERDESGWPAIVERYGIRRPYVMAFSSLSAHKNIERLIRAFAAISGQVEHDLVLAGHAAPGMDLREAARRTMQGAADGRVTVTGYVPDEHVMPLLAHADLFAFPSLYEGFGLPLLDAQAAGTAVACSRCASIPEVAGEGAEYFDALSVEEMAATLLRCLRDAPLRAALVERGRQNVQRFSWEKTARETLAVYEAAVEARRAGRRARAVESSRDMPSSDTIQS